MILDKKDFIEIYQKVPRFCVDLVIKSNDGILLSMRSIEPYNGMWHFPGGTVYKGEKMDEAAIRIAKKETGLEVSLVKHIGCVEYLNEKKFGRDTHSISVVIEAVPVGGKLKHDENATELKYFKELPDNFVEEQKEFLNNLF